MPRKSKRAHLVKAQRASRTEFFNTGFTDTIDEYINDLSYNSLEDIEQSHSNEGWTFSFLKCEIAEDEGSDEDWEDEDEARDGLGKRKCTDLEDLESDDEVIDLEEQASIEAAEKAQQLWKEFFEEVCAADKKKKKFKLKAYAEEETNHLKHLWFIAAWKPCYLHRCGQELDVCKANQSAKGGKRLWRHHFVLRKEGAR
jgi:hypothetical protein